MNPEMLNSWKEIAAYLGRGVRTVQRWEQELGLPVRRPRGRERSAVIALKPELDRWIHKTPQHAFAASNHPAPPPTHAELNVNEKLIERTHLLVQQSARMRDIVAGTLAIMTKLRDQQTRALAEQRDRVVLVKKAVLVRRSQLGGDSSKLTALAANATKPPVAS